jgi:hypothetical protein
MSLLISDDERELEVPTFLKTAKALEMSKIVGGRKPIWFKDLQNELTQKEINRLVKSEKSRSHSHSIVGPYY